MKPKKSKQRVRQSSRGKEHGRGEEGARKPSQRKQSTWTAQGGVLKELKKKKKKSRAVPREWGSVAREGCWKQQPGQTRKRTCALQVPRTPLIRSACWRPDLFSLEWGGLLGIRRSWGQRGREGACVMEREMHTSETQCPPGCREVGRAARWAFSLLTFSLSCFHILTGSQGVMVVLLLQISRVPGHNFLCLAEKNQPDYFSSRIPSCLHV